tara:strand:+ start:451 stop:672 length:222 start_codon:yes stop_codon:yes gene_type:complete
MVVPIIIGLALGSFYAIQQYIRITNGTNLLVRRNPDGSVYGGLFKMLFGVFVLWFVIGFVISGVLGLIFGLIF